MNDRIGRKPGGAAFANALFIVVEDVPNALRGKAVAACCAVDNLVGHADNSVEIVDILPNSWTEQTRR